MALWSSGNAAERWLRRGIMLMQGQLGMLSGGLPLASLGSFGKLSGLPSLGTLGSMGRSSGTEAPRFGAPRMPEGAILLSVLSHRSSTHFDLQVL